MVVKSSFNVGKMRISAKSAGMGYTRDARASMAAVIENYRKFVKRLEVSVPSVLIDALTPTLALAKYYTPVDTGTLRDSAYLNITGKEHYPHVNMGFAKGGNPPYAAKVHENLEFRHNPPTQAKFLQKALEEDANNIQNRIVYGLRENF